MHIFNSCNVLSDRNVVERAVGVEGVRALEMAVVAGFGVPGPVPRAAKFGSIRIPGSKI